MDLIKKIINKFVGRFFEKKVYVNEVYIVGGKVKYFFYINVFKRSLWDIYYMYYVKLCMFLILY